MTEDFVNGFLNSGSLIIEIFSAFHLENGPTFGLAIKVMCWQLVCILMMEDEQ